MCAVIHIDCFSQHPLIFKISLKLIHLKNEFQNRYLYQKIRSETLLSNIERIPTQQKFKMEFNRVYNEYLKFRKITFYRFFSKRILMLKVANI